MATHYSLEEWTDFVRSLVDPATRAAMMRHAEVCAGCADDRRALERLSRTMRADADTAISAGTMRRVYALATRLPAPAPSRLRRIVAVLGFDSGTQPAAVGVRSAGRGVRQMVFEAERYQVHLQWELAAPGGPVSLVGRISAVADVVLPPGLVVKAMTPSVQAGEATTNQFGEFVLECAWDPALTLHVPVATDGVRIEVPLATVTGGSGPRVPRGRTSY